MPYRSLNCLLLSSSLPIESRNTSIESQTSSSKSTKLKPNKHIHSTSQVLLQSIFCALARALHRSQLLSFLPTYLTSLLISILPAHLIIDSSPHTAPTSQASHPLLSAFSAGSSNIRVPGPRPSGIAPGLIVSESVIERVVVEGIEDREGIRGKGFV